jgi:hypothetical protein
MNQILRFDMNVPVEVALKYAGPGKHIEGRYGNRVMYTLADDRVMYAAPTVATQISDLGIQPGELFHICKQVKRQGMHRLIEWQVARLPSETETQLECELKESLAAAGAATETQPSEPNEANPQPPPASPESITPSGKSVTVAAVSVVNGSGNGNPASDTLSGNSQPAAATDPVCPQGSPALPPHKSPTPSIKQLRQWIPVIRSKRRSSNDQTRARAQDSNLSSI